MMAPTLSPEQAKAIALEIETYTARLQCGSWPIDSIYQYYDLYPAEVYNVHFTDGLTLLFIRDTDTGRLQTANALTYRAPDYSNHADLYRAEVRQNLTKFCVDVARFVERHALVEGGTSS